MGSITMQTLVVSHREPCSYNYTRIHAPFSRGAFGNALYFNVGTLTESSMCRLLCDARPKRHLNVQPLLNLVSRRLF